MIPSNLDNKKKRVVIKNIEDKKGKRFSDYKNVVAKELIAHNHNFLLR